MAQKGFNKGDLILWSLVRWKDAYFLDILTDGFHWGWSGLIYPRLLKLILFLSTGFCLSLGKLLGLAKRLPLGFVEAPHCTTEKGLILFPIRDDRCFL